MSFTPTPSKTTPTTGGHVSGKFSGTKKFLIGGGVAVALLGAPLVIGTLVTVADGSGTLAAGTLKDILPAFVESFQGYVPGTGESILEAPSTKP